MRVTKNSNMIRQDTSAYVVYVMHTHGFRHPLPLLSCILHRKIQQTRAIDMGMETAVAAG